MTVSAPKETTQKEVVELASNQSQTLFALRIFTYLVLTGIIAASILLLILPDTQRLGLTLGITGALLLFLIFLTRELESKFKKESSQSLLARESQLYSLLMDNQNSTEEDTIVPAREQALQYCQDLLEDYRNTRRTSRNIYYISQIGTIVLSGVTPILVLLDKMDTTSGFLAWLPVILPALAAIVTSVVTSFPFQETWIAANLTVEKLEAEREKFILGVSKPYRSYHFVDPAKRKAKSKKAIENFITQVNNIHLKQLESLAEAIEDEDEEENQNARETA